MQIQKYAIISPGVWQMLKTDLCGALIKKVHDEIEKKANVMLRQQDLTLSQMNVLMELEAVPDHQLTLKELEGLLHVAQSTAAGIVMRLEQKGFVESFTDENDRRVKKVTITPAGMECCKNAASDVKDMEVQLLAGLTEPERILFRDLLEKVFKAL